MAFERVGVKATVEGMAEFSANLNDMNKSVAGFANKTIDAGMKIAEGFKTLSGAVIAAGFTLYKGFQFAQLGAQAMRLEQAGKDLAKSYGQSMDDIIEAVDKASMGAVARNDIILASNKAMMLGVADTAEEMAQLMTIAAVRGRAMGISTTQAFADIVTGIGRMSPMILDNLGILTGGEKTFRDYAKSIGKAADALTDAEKKQALFNKVISETAPLLDEAGGYSADMATEFEIATAAIEDAKNELQKFSAVWLSKALIVLDIGGKRVNIINNAIEETSREMMQSSMSYRNYSDAMEGIAKAAHRGTMSLPEYNERIERGGISAHIAERSVVILTEAEWKHEKSLMAINDQMNATNWMSGELRETTENLIDTNIDAEAAAKAREKAEKALQESLQAQYDDLQSLLKINITQNYDEMVEKIEQVNEKESELRERIANVNEEIAGYRAEIQEIKDEEGPVTEEQSERIGEYKERIADATVTLGDLQTELGDIPSAIDEVREAWDKQTKQMIFDLAAQRLAADGLTSEEMEALGKLAGPQGFDLIDESSQRMIEGIALAADEMSKAGDQSDIFIEVLKDLQTEFGNTELSIEQMGEAINDLPTEWELAIKYNIGEIPELRGKKLLEQEQWGDIGIGNISIPQSAPAGASNNNYNLTINTSAPSEPIIADFEMLAAMGLER